MDTFFAIETSCDETAAAVYSKKNGMLSNVIFSQAQLHAQFGGVIPEVASQYHVEKIRIICHAALCQSGLSLSDIDCFAVTQYPGLPSSLFVGIAFAKALSWTLRKPLLGINHLEGHIFSSCIEQAVPFPHLCLTASGGHTALYFVENFNTYTLLGETVDDAAGEAFDKIAKLLGVGYPGGPIIEKMAQCAQFQDFFHYPRSSMQGLNFSFSGLKTAVLYDLVKRGLYCLQSKTFKQTLTDEFKQQVASSLLVCIADIFIKKLTMAREQNPSIKAITFVGGVACNAYIRKRMQELAASLDLPFYTPSAQYCTDNAAMIALVASKKPVEPTHASYTLDIGSL